MEWLALLLFPARSRSYGVAGQLVHKSAAAAIALALGLVLMGNASAADRPIRIVALGDSLIAGFGLPEQEAFPARLARALQAKGFAVEIVNAGVSGDTASGGLARLDWSVPEGADAVILELGGNDALRGIDPKVTRAAIERILQRLEARGVEVLLCGMQAPRNLGGDYAREFDSIFAELAAQHGAILYPFFLEGVAVDPKFTQSDRLHPNADGVGVIVAGILPQAEALIARVRAKRGG